jgi:hypothetical protein
MLELKGLYPRRKRSWLGPTRYVPRCKCGKALEQRGNFVRHVGPCDACQAAVLEMLRLAYR